MPRPVQDQGHGPVAVCVLRLEQQEEALLVSLSINPDIRLRTTSRSFRTLDLERALDAVRQTAAQLMAAKPLAISPSGERFDRTPYLLSDHFRSSPGIP